MAITQEQRYEQMMHERIETLIPKLAIPSIISMLITAIYNMADTFFVSQIGTSASGAVGIIFSMTSAVQAMAFTIGMGAGNMISRLLGQKQDEMAERYAAVGFFTELIVGGLIAAIGLSNIQSMVRLLGATETIAPFAEEYARYILYGTPFFMCSLGMNNMLRFQGNSFYSMIGIGTGGVLNMILDPILIFGFHMGIAGAAIATAFSQFISFLILLSQCNRMPACISIRVRNFRPTIEMFRNIFFIGMPSLARQGIMSVSTIILNHTAAPFGDAAIAAMAIVTRISMFMNSAVIGFGQGFQPVCGFNYGAKQYKRVARAYYFSLKVTFCFLLIMAAIVFVFAGPLVTVFRREDAEVIRIGTLALRLQCITMPFAAQITMANMFSQTVGYGFRATLVASLKFGICLIPALMILPPLFGLLGIQMAQPVSDIASVIISFLITKGILKDLKRLSGKGE